MSAKKLFSGFEQGKKPLSVKTIVRCYRKVISVPLGFSIGIMMTLLVSDFHAKTLFLQLGMCVCVWTLMAYLVYRIDEIKYE